MSTPIYFYKAKNLSNLKADSIVAVKNDNESAFSLYVTDRSGIPYPLKGLQNNVIITNTDGNLQITSSSTSTNINLSSSILATINSALQNGDNISELVNDVGYLTTFTEIDPIFQASEASLFISGDKLKLDGIEDGAEVNNISDANAIDLTDGGDTSLHNHDSRYYTEIEADNKYVPYTGATTNVDLGEYQLKAGQLEFDQTPTGTFTTGKVRWNDSDGTIEVMLKGGNVTLQVGQEQLLRVVNKTGVNLLESEYKCVYISGAQGNRLKVDLALSNNTVNSNKTIGLVTENISDNLEGFVTTSGLVREINTTGSLQGETWLDGDVLYLSATTTGGLTNVIPVSPNHKVLAGYVVRAHVTQGSIFVKVDTGLSLGELHNTSITGTTINKVLGSTTEGLWENKSVSDVLGYTPANDANVVKTIITDTPTSTNTLSVSEVLMHTYTIAGGKLPSSCMPNLKVRISKLGTVGTVTIKVRVNTVNDFATATNIGFFTTLTSSRAAVFVRNFTLQGGQLTSYNTANSLVNDEAVSGVDNGVITYDPNVTQYWFFSLQNSNSGDTTRIHSIKLVN